MIPNIIIPIIDTVKQILPTLAKLGPKIEEALTKVADIISSISEILGFAKQDIEELGAKAECSNLNPDDFDTYDEYMKALQKTEIDRKALEKVPFEVRLARGTKILIDQIDNKFPVGLSELLPEIYRNSEYFNPKRVSTIINTFAEIDMTLRDIGLYFSEDLSTDDALKTEDLLVDVERKINPNSTETDVDIIEIIQRMRH